MKFLKILLVAAQLVTGEINLDVNLSIDFSVKVHITAISKSDNEIMAPNKYIK